MSHRIYMSVDETRPENPVPVITIMGRELRLSHKELNFLEEEIQWTKNSMKNMQRHAFTNLVRKYS